MTLLSCLLQHDACEPRELGLLALNPPPRTPSLPPLTLCTLGLGTHPRITRGAWETHCWPHPTGHDAVGLGWEQEFAFPASSKVMLRLLVWRGLQSGPQDPHPCLSLRLREDNLCHPLKE